MQISTSDFFVFLKSMTFAEKKKKKTHTQDLKDYLTVKKIRTRCTKISRSIVSYLWFMIPVLLLINLHKVQIILNQNKYIHTNILCSQIAWLIEVGRGKHKVLYNLRKKLRRGKEKEDKSIL